MVVSAPAFDDMEHRPVIGTTGWTENEIIPDVPPDASLISFGALLRQAGQVWADGFRPEVVDRSLPPSFLLQQHSDIHFRFARNQYEQDRSRNVPLNPDFEEG